MYINNQEKLLARSMALDVFATAYHTAEDKGTFLIGLVCALVDDIGIEQAVHIFAAGLSFDRQETKGNNSTH